MISKQDYTWLERHTEILNRCRQPEDYARQNLRLKIYRPHHLQKLQQIFAQYPCQSGHNQKELWLKIKGLTIDDFNDIARCHHGDLIYHTDAQKIFYIPQNKRSLQKTLRRATPRLLTNLSNRKKLDILFAYGQKVFLSEQQQAAQELFIEENSHKFFSLLQLKIPARFMAEEHKKVKQIVANLAELPDIKNKLINFAALPFTEQKELLSAVSRLTAEVNGITPPKIHYLSQKQINNDENIAKWIETDAFSDENDIYINKDLLRAHNGIDCLALAFHETTHIAQTHADYPDFPEIEDMFSPRLDYLQRHEDTYLFIPQELVTYNLELDFCRTLAENTGVTPTNNEFISAAEYDIATQYIRKSLRRAY